MTNRSAGVGVRCPIGLFDAHEVGVLLACASYEAANLNCNLCRGFSTLRLQTANLVVKAGARAAP